MSATKKAIIFARVSTKRQEKEGLSLRKIQLPNARNYAKQNNLTVVKEFIVGETGGDQKARKNFDEMIDYVKKNKDVTEIVSFRVDRLTRNFRDAVTMDDLRKNHGKFLHLIDDRLVLHSDSPARDLTQWNVKVFIAQEYINRVTEDGNGTKYQKLENGELPWCAPYGYKHVVISQRPKRKSVITVEPKATIVRQIYLRYATGSYSCASLAKSINSEFGTHMNKGQIHHILTDKFYAGVMIDKKTGKEYPHFYERLVGDDIYEQCMAVISGHSTKRQRFDGITSTYRGLITCADCGCTITPDPKKKKLANGKIKRYFYYHCTNGKGKHKSLTNITEEELDNAIRQVLKQFNIPQQRMEQLRKELNEAHESKNSFYEEQRKEIVARRKQLSNRQQKAYDTLMDGGITLDKYNENNARYEAELAEIQRKEERLDNADQHFYITVGYLLSLFEHAEQLFEVAETDEKKQIIGLILSNLKLDGKKLTFTLKKPFNSLLSQPKGLLWLALQDLIRNPSKYIISLNDFNVELTKSLLMKLELQTKEFVT